MSSIKVDDHCDERYYFENTFGKAIGRVK